MTTEIRTHASEPPEEPAFSWRAIMEIVQALALAVIISVVLNLFVVQVTEVRQRSMEMTLLQGDRVLVSKVDYRIGEPDRGDIVVFDPPAEMNSTIPYVKRIIAIGGDKVEIRDGRVLVNDRPTLPDVTSQAQSPQIQYPFTVPAGHFFALGDNRGSSQDSRTFGSVPNENIIGKVVIRFWPFDRLRFFEW